MRIAGETTRPISPRVEDETSREARLHAEAAARVSIVVPTYCEAENIGELVREITGAGIEGEIELLLMDDDSPDGTAEVVAGLGVDWVELVVRKENRGLSQAVLDGLARARGEFVVVMDADLSHPPAAIGLMLEALEAGADMAIASRFVAGASTDETWGIFRRLNSKVATLLAMGLTKLSDPMSGFFALRREMYLAGRGFSPLGYKIGLELMLKCPIRQVAEIPIHFANRAHGYSKLSIKEQFRYLRHLGRLYWHAVSHPEHGRPRTFRAATRAA